jgi:hypothetical protein
MQAQYDEPQIIGSNSFSPRGLELYLSRRSAAEQKHLLWAWQMADFSDERDHFGKRTVETLIDMDADADVLIAYVLTEAMHTMRTTIDEIHSVCGDKITKNTEHLQHLFGPPSDDSARLQTLITLVRHDIRLGVVVLIHRLEALQQPMNNARVVERILHGEAKLADLLCMQDVRDLLEKQSLCITQPSLFQAFTALQARMEDTAREILLPEMEQLAAGSPFTPMEFRHEASCWNDLRSLLEERERMVPPVIVCICDEIDHCYTVLGLLHQTWRFDPHGFRDDIAIPRRNGLQELKTIVTLPDGTRADCRIRTRDMHEFARRGIASVCFGEDVFGVEEYLPWLKDVPSASAVETMNRETWNTVEAELLGNRITIRTADGTSIELPEHATALDAVLSFYGERGLFAQSISIHERPIPFDTPLQHGNLLHVTFSGAHTVDGSWLQSARTWTALSLIKQALGSEPQERKIAVGRSALQQLMTEHQTGFLEEFDPAGFRPGLEKAGYASLEALCIAIADGRVHPEQAYAILFQKTEDTRLHTRHIQGMFHTQNLDVLRSIARIAEKHHLKATRIQWGSAIGLGRDGFVSLSGNLAAREHLGLIGDLRMVGITNIQSDTVASLRWYAAGAIIVNVLWGLDPVLAKLLLTSDLGVHPHAFALFRAIGFCLACGVFVLLLPRRSLPRQHIPWKDPTLWAAGASLATIAFGTYASLQFLLPQDYMTIMLLSILLAPVIYGFLRGQRRRGPLLLGLGIVLGAVLILLTRQETRWFLTHGPLLLLGTCLFTICMDLLKRRHHVAVRMPVTLLAVSFIALLATVLLLPFSAMRLPNAPIMALLTLYGATFIAIPYIVFDKLLNTRGVRWFAQFYLLAVGVALLGQATVFRVFNITSLVLIAILGIAALVLYRRQRLYPTTVEDTEWKLFESSKTQD